MVAIESLLMSFPYVSNYSDVSNDVKLVQCTLTGVLLHYVHWGGDWELGNDSIKCVSEPYNIMKLEKTVLHDSIENKDHLTDRVTTPMKC